jgi:hypothetical protein
MSTSIKRHSLIAGWSREHSGGQKLFKSHKTTNKTLQILKTFHLLSTNFALSPDSKKDAKTKTYVRGLNPSVFSKDC